MKFKFVPILIFVIVIIVLLIISFLFKKENFNSEQKNNNSGGIYNYFYKEVLNPYKYPMTKFFSNDSTEISNDKKN